MQPSACEHQLEAVVVARVVAGRDLDAAARHRVRGEVQHRRGDRAQLDDVDAAGHQAADEGIGQRRGTQAPVAPDGDAALAFAPGHVAERGAELARECRVECCRHHAADVIRLENARGMHGAAILVTRPAQPRGAHRPPSAIRRPSSPRPARAGSCGERRRRRMRRSFPSRGIRTLRPASSCSPRCTRDRRRSR